MAKKPKNKMSAEHRAKQFMPFAAVKGYEAALREKEKQMFHEEQKSGQSNIVGKLIEK